MTYWLLIFHENNYFMNQNNYQMILTPLLQKNGKLLHCLGIMTQKIVQSLTTQNTAIGTMQSISFTVIFNWIS